MTGTVWLRCTIPDGPRQARRLSEAQEVARGLSQEHGHVSVEISSGCVFCDLYYSGPQSASYIVTALHLATGERFVHERTFAPLRSRLGERDESMIVSS
jgi:hypothetical protein